MNKGKTYVKENPALINASSILYEGGGKTLDKLFDLVYPVGSVYISTSATSPQTLFGGSWTKIEGRFLWATVNTPKNTGGTSKHTHNAGSLVACYDPKNYYNNALFRLKNVDKGWTLSGYMSESRGWNDGGGSTGRGIEVIGSTSEVDTLPPYFEVYMWYRTA